MDKNNRNKRRGDGVGEWKLGSDLQPESLDRELDFGASERANENENCICRPHSWLQLESPISLQNRIADSRFGFLNLPFTSFFLLLLCLPPCHLQSPLQLQSFLFCLHIILAVAGGAMMAMMSSHSLMAM